MTIATATFNREKEMRRLYKSMVELRLATKNEIVFEWIIVDDGSSDNTRGLVATWCEENKLPVKYYYQENQGKHIAINLATDAARGEAFLTIDSDDELLPQSVNVFHDTWFAIPEEVRRTLKGVTGRCISPHTGQILGTPLPQKINGGKYLITSPQDLRYKYKIKGEMCGFNLTEIMRTYRLDIGNKIGKYLPESILWGTIGMDYKEYVIDVPVRIYNDDGNGAITAGSSKKRAPQNYYLWQFNVNNFLSKYLFSAPKDMLKSVVGMSRDGFLTNRSISTILNDCKGAFAKSMVLLFMPAGWILAKI